MIVSSLSELSRHFGKTRNAVMYQIRLGRLPDPRYQGIETDGLSWPQGNCPGRKKGTRNTYTRQTIEDLIMRVAELEKRLSAVENLSGEHG